MPAASRFCLKNKEIKKQPVKGCFFADVHTGKALTNTNTSVETCTIENRSDRMPEVRRLQASYGHMYHWQGHKLRYGLPFLHYLSTSTISLSIIAVAPHTVCPSKSKNGA